MSVSSRHPFSNRLWHLLRELRLSMRLPEQQLITRYLQLEQLATLQPPIQEE